MKRYAVVNQRASVTHSLNDTLGEALASAIQLQDQGGRPAIIDSQGSGRIELSTNDIAEAEYLVGRKLDCDDRHELDIETVLDHAARTSPPKVRYHWDVSGNDV